MGCKLENIILLYSLCNDLYVKRDAVRYALHIIDFYMHTNHPLYLFFDLKCILIGCKIPCYLANLFSLIIPYELSIPLSDFPF